MGNHVQRALQPNVVTAICHSHISIIEDQGAECLNSNLNTLNMIFKNIPNSIAQLRTVADQHLLTTTEASILLPGLRKRKVEYQAAGSF